MNHENDVKEYLKTPPEFAQQILKDQEDEKRQSEQIDGFIQQVSKELMNSFNIERQNYFIKKLKETVINGRAEILKHKSQQMERLRIEIETIEAKTEQFANS